MDCSETKELLSAYYDGELSSSERTAVANHVAACEDCAHILEGFRRLSTMAEVLTQPEPPARIWHAIEEQLHLEPAAGSERPTFLARLGWPRKPVVRFGVAAAAAVLIASVWVGYKTWLGRGDGHPFAPVFAQYLQKFCHDPHEAQRILLANYEGWPVDAQHAMNSVGYHPAVAEGMPQGYTIETTYVMKMPCCTCVQCLCQRGDETIIAIFEHDDKETDWFGDRPATEAICNGIRCNLIQLDDRFAATWRCGKRYITVVGARDTAEVERLVAWFEDHRQIAPK